MEINIQRIREGKVTSIEKIVMIHWKYNIAAGRRYFKRYSPNNNHLLSHIFILFL